MMKEYRLLAAAFHRVDVGERPVEFAFVLAAAEHGADADEQLVLLDRFGNEVVGADVGGALHVAGLVQGRDHEDRYVVGRGVGAEALAHLEAAEARHHDVEQNQVGLPGCDLLQRLFAVGRGAQLVATIAQVGLQQLHPLGVVVGDKDARRPVLGGGFGRRRGAHTDLGCGARRPGGRRTPPL